MAIVKPRKSITQPCRSAAHSACGRSYYSAKSSKYQLQSEATMLNSTPTSPNLARSQH